jgi:hypothetical protein
MLEKEFVPYEESLALKELGFDEPCFGYYVDGELRGVNLGLEELGGVKPYYKRFGFHTICNSDINNTEKSVVTAPTYSQAFRWFREKYDIDIDIDVVFSKHNDGKNYKVLIPFPDELFINVGLFTTYKEAELACLRKLIEIVKEKHNVGDSH